MSQFTMCRVSSQTRGKVVKMQPLKQMVRCKLGSVCMGLCARVTTASAQHTLREENYSSTMCTPPCEQTLCERTQVFPLSLSLSPDFISIQKEHNSLLNVIKAGGEVLGGCQQDDCWVAGVQGVDEQRPARVEMQLLLSALLPGEKQGAGETTEENLRWGRSRVLRVEVTGVLRGHGHGCYRRVPSEYCGRLGTAGAILRSDAVRRHFEELCTEINRE